jgi:lipoyl-dependent peroxiredoxin
MALAGVLTRAGHKPRSIEAATRVHLDKVEDAFSITTIEFATEASVPISPELQRHAEEAKRNCPVSKALAGVDIKLDARLAA